MKTNIKRKMNDALENIANRRTLVGWIVCNHLMCKDIAFSIFKVGNFEGEGTTITIDEVDFTYYAGTTENDIMPIALKIIEDIKEVEL